MTNSATRPVVAGVDGSTSALHAVRWAAREAVRRDVPLRLVHACLAMPSGEVPLPPDYHDALLDQGRRWLDRAADAARAVAPEVSVDTDVLDGVTNAALVRESETAQLLVLGSRGLGGFRGLLAGSVSVALAAHAHCPVVVMRGPGGEGVPPEEGPVVVGVDGSPLSDAAVEFAFAGAAGRGVPLVAVHSWLDVDMAAAGWAAWPTLVDWEQVGAEEARRLDEVLAGWVEKFPDVVVRKVVERDRPQRALLKAAAGAQLVVVGSRGRGALTGLGLGSVSQSLLHHAECPVAVVRVPTR